MPKASTWTGPEVEYLMFLRDTKKMKWAAIAFELNRSRTAVQAKWTYVQYGCLRKRDYDITPLLHTVRSVSIVPPECEEERDIRMAASARDLTGAFFGDPPVGYSALDRKMSGATP